MIPPGWRAANLGDICQLVNGRGFKPHEWKEEGLPIIRIQNLNGSADFNFYDGEYDPKIEIIDGQLLFAWSGSRGTSFGPHIWCGPKALLNYHTWKVVAFDGVDQIFLLHLLRHLTLEIERSAHGAAALVHTQKGDMEKFAVVVPFLPEQLRIAEILSTWDRAIETVEALIANARAQKAALMQQLLTGKRRLPGFSGEWLDLKLGDAAMVDRDSLGQNTPKTFSFRYISLSDVQSGRIAEKLPNLAFAEAPSRARRKVRVGDILMATVRPNLQAFARVGSEHADCIASTGFAVLSHRAGFDPSFMFHSLFSQRFTDQIEALVVGSNYPAINSTDIKSLTLLFPDFEEQKAVGELLDVADAEVRMLESELTALRQEKAALMQQLLTGKRRVKLDTASAP